MSATNILRFERFTLDKERGSVIVSSKSVKLRPKSFQLLQFMAENPGRLLSKAEILDHVWGAAQVTEDAVAQCVIDIRRALNDTDQLLIKTVPRRGYVLDAEPISDRPSGKQLRSLRAVLVGALALVLIAAILWAVQNGPDSTKTGIADETKSATVAVLPFIDLSAEGDLGYFAEGVAEEIINLLTPVDDLRVIARTSSFSRKVREADIETIQELLAVSHVLEGSVREQGGTVRVSVQLIDAATGERVWVQDYQRQMGDILIIQDQIAGEVLQRLARQFQFPATIPYQPDAKAYRLYLQALYLLNSAPPDKLSDIEELITESLAIDSNFAPAWREYSRVWLRKITAGHDPKIALVNMNEALARANELDPDDAVMIAYRAWHAADFEGDPEKAARLFATALAAESANENILRGAMMFMLAFGSPDDTVRLGEYGVLTNPLCLICYGNLAAAYEQQHNFAAASTTWNKVDVIFERVPDADGLSLLLTGREEELLARHNTETPARQRLFEEALAFQSLGRLTDAEEAVRQYVDLTKDQRQWGSAMLFARTGRTDEAFAALEKSVSDSQVVLDGQIVRYNLIRIGMILQSPLLEHLHGDPRWEALHNRIGLIQPDLQALSNLISKLDVDTDA